MNTNEPMGTSGMPPNDDAIAPSSPASASEMEMCVPVASLAMPGEDDKLNNPGVGDPVQMMAEGTVSRIEGENAYVSVKSVNGKPVDSEGAMTTNTPESDESGDNEFAALQQQASQMPQRM